MKAIVIARPIGPEGLELREVPAPVPQGDQILVRVRACGLNPADVLQSRGRYPAPPGAPAEIPGLEYAGEVAARGQGVVGSLREGDRVFGLVGGGAFAEFVLTHERMAVPIPSNLDFEAAAALPEVFITAHDALETRAGLRPGQRVLIHTVGGGVGSAAVQIAHAMGCFVFGTSRSAWKLEKARELGLDVDINTSHDEFAAVIQQRTGGAGVHAILDTLGATALTSNLAALAPLGRIVQVGLLGGATAVIDLALLMQRRATLVGTNLRGRPLEEKIAATRIFADRVVPWLERGVVRPIVDQIIEFDNVRAALERLTSAQSFGKIVLKIS
jgi:NADPH2:quinone reductase